VTSPTGASAVYLDSSAFGEAVVAEPGSAALRMVRGARFPGLPVNSPS
jgi:hypothetical protein